MEVKRTFNDGIFGETEWTITPSEMRKEVNAALRDRFTALQWIGSIAEEVAASLLPYLVDGADELPMPGNIHLRDGSPDLARDLIVAWQNCWALGNAAHVKEFGLTELMQAYYLGCAIQRWKVRPKSHMVKKQLRANERLAENRQTINHKRRDYEKDCRDELAKQRKKAAGRVSHTQLLGKVALETGIGLRTVKKYCPKNPKK